MSRRDQEDLISIVDRILATIKGQVIIFSLSLLHVLAYIYIDSLTIDCLYEQHVVNVGVCYLCTFYYLNLDCGVWQISPELYLEMCIRWFLLTRIPLFIMLLVYGCWNWYEVLWITVETYYSSLEQLVSELHWGTAHVLCLLVRAMSCCIFVTELVFFIKLQQQLINWMKIYECLGNCCETYLCCYWIWYSGNCIIQLNCV